MIHYDDIFRVFVFYAASILVFENAINTGLTKKKKKKIINGRSKLKPIGSTDNLTCMDQPDCPWVLVIVENRFGILDFNTLDPLTHY